jgi:hypothetical protein
MREISAIMILEFLFKLVIQSIRIVNWQLRRALIIHDQSCSAFCQIKFSLRAIRFSNRRFLFININWLFAIIIKIILL